jgi:hypothetical protein
MISEKGNPRMIKQDHDYLADIDRIVNRKYVVAVDDWAPVVDEVRKVIQKWRHPTTHGPT